MQPSKVQEWWRSNAADNTPMSPAGHADTVLADDAADDSKLPFYALLLFTFILLLAPQQIFPVLAPLRIAMLSILLVGSVHLGTRLSRGLPVMHWPPGVLIALALTAWAIFTVPLSMWPGGSLALLTDQYFKTIIVFLLLASVVNSSNKLIGICLALVLMAIPLAFTAINNYLSGVTMADGQRIVGYNAPLSENPNDMALLLNLLLPLAIGMFLSATGGLKRLALAAVVALMVIGVFATFSRGGFLTLAVIFVCYFYLLRKRAERFLAPIVLLLALLALPVLPGDYFGRISTIANVESDDTGSAQIRLRDSIAAIRLISQDPFVGSGIGTNSLAMNDVRGATWTEIHNVYLTIGVELGMPGLILFLMLLIAAVKACQSMLVRTGDLPEHYRVYCLAEGLKVSLIAFSVAAVFHPVAYHFYFYYIAGLSMALSQITLPSSVTTNQGRVREVIST